MAAIGRKTSKLLLLAVTLSFSAPPSKASDLLEPVNRVAGGLSNNNAGDALAPFDKSFTGYAQLQRYFAALCDSYLISNEAEVLDQSDTADTAALTVRWTMTLTSQGTDENIRRSESVHIELSRKNRKWKIVDLKPVSFFDPEAK